MIECLVVWLTDSMPSRCCPRRQRRHPSTCTARRRPWSPRPRAPRRHPRRCTCPPSTARCCRCRSLWARLACRPWTPRRAARHASAPSCPPPTACSTRPSTAPRPRCSRCPATCPWLTSRARAAWTCWRPPTAALCPRCQGWCLAATQCRAHSACWWATMKRPLYPARTASSRQRSPPTSPAPTQSPSTPQTQAQVRAHNHSRIHSSQQAARNQHQEQSVIVWNANPLQTMNSNKFLQPWHNILIFFTSH